MYEEGNQLFGGGKARDHEKCRWRDVRWGDAGANDAARHVSRWRGRGLTPDTRPPSGQSPSEHVFHWTSASASLPSLNVPRTRMAPNSAPTVTECPISKEAAQQPIEKYRVKIVWSSVIFFVYLHVAAVYGSYLLLFSAKWATVIFTIGLFHISGFGVTAGAHRLWSHRTYKARLPLKILLAIFNTMAFQKSIYHWARDHRLHHKYSDTDADPHNATRGFFFSHIGWLLCRKHPQVIEKGKGIDISDLERDPVVMFQKKYYLYLVPVTCFLLPTFIPMYFWNETFANAWFTSTMFRYVWALNVTWLVNSAAHMFGNRPYDKNINPAENSYVIFFAIGEGFHNYHHVFPWDYKTAELGNYKLNLTTAFIDLMAMIGQAYDCKTVPEHIIKSRVRRTGDGSHPWGWGDKDIPEEDRNAATTLYRKEPLAWGWDDKDLPDQERKAVVNNFKKD